MPEYDAPKDRLPRWVRVLDTTTLIVFGLAVVVFLTGGFRTQVAGLRISITSATRVLLWAVAIAAIRHVAHRRVTLLTRLRNSPTLARLGPELSHREGPWLAGNQATRWSSPAVFEYLGLGLLLLALTLLMTFPQIAALDQVRDMGDPLFSVWRLSWVAHQLPRDPLHLFDANIFYPAKHTLALSDSMLLPAFVSAPFLWLGAPGVKLANVWVLASFVMSGVAMYALLKALTGQRAAALVAAAAFAFYPFRFEHYSHFELQLSFWMPLVLLASHRAVASGRTRDGLLAGAALAAQIYSCMYFGVFLAAFLVPVIGLLLLGTWTADHRPADTRGGPPPKRQSTGSLRTRARAVRPFIAGALLTAVLVAPLAMQYLSARQQFGARGPIEVKHYSATASRYLVAHPVSATWGAAFDKAFEHVPEQDLFPGLLIVVLALVGLWPPLNLTRIAYACGLLFAFDASLGVHGRVYPSLYEYVAPFRSIRVPARMSMLVGLSLSVLAGYGVARLAALLRKPVGRYALAAACCAIICFETRPLLAFEQPVRLHAIYAWFTGRPTTVIAELPTPGDVPARLWQDIRYQYLSTFHWNKLLNGNSGILPESYLTFSRQMTTFPDDTSLRLLRSMGAKYVVVHEEFYDDREAYRRVVDASAGRADLVEVARAVDRGTEARVYAVGR